MVEQNWILIVLSYQHFADLLLHLLIQQWWHWVSHLFRWNFNTSENDRSWNRWLLITKSDFSCHKFGKFFLYGDYCACSNKSLLLMGNIYGILDTLMWNFFQNKLPSTNEKWNPILTKCFSCTKWKTPMKMHPFYLWEMNCMSDTHRAWNNFKGSSTSEK